MTPDTPMPNQQDERFGEHAFALLSANAPSLDTDALWARIAPGVTPASGPAHTRAWWAGLALPSMPALAPFGRRTGLALAGTAALGMAVAWNLGTGGETASAALLQSARSLSAVTDAAFADGTLSDAEIARLQGDAERLLQRILRDPAGLRSLDGPDLEALTQVLTALEDRLRPDAEVAAPALRHVESAAGLATDALRVSYPGLAVRFERSLRITAATPGVQAISAGDAGSLDIDVQTSGLSVVRTAPASGWVTTVEQPSGREVEVEFRRTSDGRRVQVNVELEDGRLRTRIDDSAASVSATPGVLGMTEGTRVPGVPVLVEEDDEEVLGFTDVTTGTNTFPAGPAGSVTITNNGSTLTLVSVNPSAGWTYSVDSVSARELEVDFLSGSSRIRFNVELEDGQVRIRTEARLESLSGSGSSGSGSSDGSSGSGSSGSGSSGSGSSGSGSSGSGSSGSGSDDSSSSSSSTSSGSGSSSSGSGSSGGGDDAPDSGDDGSGRNRGGRR